MGTQRPPKFSPMFIIVIVISLEHCTKHSRYWFIMVGLCHRADHYIFAVVSSFFFFASPNLSGRRLDVYHDTSTHGVALVRI